MTEAVLGGAAAAGAKLVFADVERLEPYKRVRAGPGQTTTWPPKLREIIDFARTHEGEATWMVTLRRFTLILLAIGAASIAGGCGDDESSSGTTTTEWADNLCSAITTWTNSVKSAGESLEGGNLSKESLTSAADDITSATGTFADDLKGLGTPDTEAAQQAQDSIDQLSSDIETNVNEIESAIDNASGVSGTSAAITTITRTLSTMSGRVSSTFSDLEGLDASAELEEAFREADSCSSLTQ
jgi:hypothetical protein